MSRNKKNPNKGKKFIFFVKTLDEDGFVDESKCGWLTLDPKFSLIPVKKSMATIFIEKEHKHGSSEDWMKFFSQEYKNLLFNVVYVS